MNDSFADIEANPAKDKEGESSNDSSQQSKVFWKLDYYQQFFNVTTSDVGHRVLSSMIPNRKGFIDMVSSNPDLYGPLWICITLIVTASMSGNIAKYFGTQGLSVWTFQFQEVTTLASILFIYTWVVPIVLWAVLIWRVGQANTHSLFSMITLYGYSLSIYIPVSILWTLLIRFASIQWAITMSAAALSGGVLAISFWPVIKKDKQRIAYGVIAAIILLHVLLAVGFQLYFFRSVSTSPPALAVPTQPPNVRFDKKSETMPVGIPVDSEEDVDEIEPSDGEGIKFQGNVHGDGIDTIGTDSDQEEDVIIQNQAEDKKPTPVLSPDSHEPPKNR